MNFIIIEQARNISDISILQGRNSVDDVDYFDHALLECSEDGTAWTPLSKELKKQYVILLFLLNGQSTLCILFLVSFF